ncbi:DUF3086 domain-containing protein [Trichothermofontia sp.]
MNEEVSRPSHSNAEPQPDTPKLDIPQAKGTPGDTTAASALSPSPGISSEMTPPWPATDVDRQSEPERATDTVGNATAVHDPVAHDPVAHDPVSEAVADLAQQVADLRAQEITLKQAIADLQVTYTQTVKEQLAEAQTAVKRLMRESLHDLEQRRQTLQLAVEQLERRQERIRAEMRTTFAGTSQDLAIRVQGFKDYLVGSLQDLVTAAEQLQLVPSAVEPSPVAQESVASPPPANPQFAEQTFQEQAKRIRRLLDQYRSQPDYYGPPWQLRRTFEPIHADRVSDWFFTQGGRGALRSLGSRLQNVLVAAAVISILHRLYGDRLRTLVLANTPERLGDWRRGLQDCLGIARTDFGPNAGIGLFESPESLAIKAERIQKNGDLPLILIDETEEVISLALLQFPLWLAFAPDPRSSSYL